MTVVMLNGERRELNGRATVATVASSAPDSRAASAIT